MSDAMMAPAPKPILVDGFLENPYPVYRRFLDEGPIHLVAMGPGMQAVFSYSLASSLLKDPRFSARRTGMLMLAIPEEHRDVCAASEVYGFVAVVHGPARALQAAQADEQGLLSPDSRPASPARGGAGREDGGRHGEEERSGCDEGAGASFPGEGDRRVTRDSRDHA